jgi:hypothetical protein
MSQEKVNRRRFLADLLFAGGALSAAALLAQSTRHQAAPATTHSPASPASTPEPLATPAASPSDCPLPGEAMPPEPHVEGDVAPPREPVLGGKPAMPQPEPHTKGKVALPSKKRP